MARLDQELARQRASLRALEDARAREINAAYSTVAARLSRNLRALTQEMEDAQARGVEVRPGWLFTQHRYRRLIAELTEHTDTFLTRASKSVADGQRSAIEDAVEDGRRLVRLALGPAPRDVVSRVTGRWDRLPAPALDHLIGRASDGTPLGDLLHELSPLAPRKVRDTLAYGVATGKHPRVVAREVQAAARITPNRALVIARTEIVGAHREGTTATWKQTGIVQEWEWTCARNARTCPACWAQDGSRHPMDEPLGSHPQCRCARIPVTPSWDELGIPGVPDRRPVLQSGAEAFARLSDADKLAILGRAKLDAYNAGQITLSDLLQHTHSARWGAGIRVASLAEALA